MLPITSTSMEGDTMLTKKAVCCSSMHEYWMVLTALILQATSIPMIRYSTPDPFHEVLKLKFHIEGERPSGHYAQSCPSKRTP